mgnify:CR=1 FL=1
MNPIRSLLNLFRSKPKVPTIPVPSQALPGIKPYLDFRATIRKLQAEIPKRYITSELLTEANRIFGLIRQGTAVYEGENEVDFIVDTTIYETFSGRRVIDLAWEEREKYFDPDDHSALDSMRRARSSALCVTGVSSKESVIELYDLLVDCDLELVDIGLCESIKIRGARNTTMFTRLLPFGERYTTSGAVFIFEHPWNDLEGPYRELLAKIPEADESLRSRVAFFNLNRRMGMQMKMM